MSAWPWLKALHLIFMVTWFAGLFYLPRLFVYHAQAEDEISKARFIIMERKLFAIGTLGGILTLVFGLWMLAAGAWDAYGNLLWLQLKLGLIGVMILYHWYCQRLLIAFKNNQNPHGHVWYRWFNEFPVLLLVAIVLLAVIRP